MVVIHPAVDSGISRPIQLYLVLNLSVSLGISLHKHVQVPEVVMNLIFSYHRRDFAPLVPILQSIWVGGVGREVTSEG